MKSYIFTRKLVLVLCTSIFVPSLLICIMLSYYTINRYNREVGEIITETEISYQTAIRECYKDYDTLVKSIINYNTLNTMLSANDKIPLDKRIDYSYEIGNVLNCLMAPLPNVELTIFTENTNVPEFKYIKKIEDKNLFKYRELKRRDDVMLRFSMENGEAYLYVFKKYNVTVDGYGGGHVIEFRVPISEIFPLYEHGENIFTVYEDVDGERIIPLCSDKEDALMKYEAYTGGKKRLFLKCATYEMNYFDGTFYVLVDRQNYIEVVGKIIIGMASIFILFSICIIGIATYTTKRLTKRLVDIVTAIRYDSIEMMFSNGDDICDEFDVIERKMVSLAQELKKENDKVLQLELESLNHRIAPHFIYNNLSVIKWKCNDRNVDNIIDCLVLYYRKVFQKNSAFTTVEEEVENLDNYIRLLRFAYEDDFSYQTNVDQELILYNIPTNIIQPLIENAFFHGINNITDQMGRIKLEIFKENNCVIIEVWDNGNKEAGIQKKTESSTTVIDRRIKLYYGSSYGLRRFSRDGFTIAQIEMPFVLERE